MQLTTRAWRRNIVLAALLMGSINVAHAADNEKFESQTQPQDVQRIVTELQKNLANLGTKARITSCSNVTTYVVDGAGEDSSFGGYCEISVGAKKQTYAMCDDYMFGRFTLSENVLSTDDGIRQFIKANCPPGG